MDRYGDFVEKHLAGKHDQKTHGLRSLSAEEVAVPKEKRQALLNLVVKALDATDIPITLNGPGPLTDFGDGDMGVPYGIYDDDNHKIDLYDEAFIYGEKVFAASVAHEVTHYRYDMATKFNAKGKYGAILDESSSYGKKLADADGISDYSSHYWTVLNKAKKEGRQAATSWDEINFASTVSETLAEAARIKIEDPAKYTKVPKIWKDLYSSIAKDGKKK